MYVALRERRCGVEMVTTVVGWTAWAGLAGAAFLWVSYLLRDDAEYGRPDFRLTLYWLFLVAGAFVFTVSDLSRLHILWSVPLFGLLAFRLDDSLSSSIDNDSSHPFNKYFVDVVLGGHDKQQLRFGIVYGVVLLLFVASIVLRQRLQLPQLTSPLVHSLAFTILVGVVVFGTIIWQGRISVHNLTRPKCGTCGRDLSLYDGSTPLQEWISLMVQAGLSGNIAQQCKASGESCQRCLERSG